RAAIDLLLRAYVEILPFVVHRLLESGVIVGLAAHDVAGREQVEFRPPLDGVEQVEVSTALELFIAMNRTFRKLLAGVEPTIALVAGGEPNRFREILARKDDMIGDRRGTLVEARRFADPPYVRKPKVSRGFGIAWIDNVRGRQGFDHRGKV